MTKINADTTADTIKALLAASTESLLTQADHDSMTETLQALNTPGSVLVETDAGAIDELAEALWAVYDWEGASREQIKLAAAALTMHDLQSSQP